MCHCHLFESASLTRWLDGFVFGWHSLQPVFPPHFSISAPPGLPFCFGFPWTYGLTRTVIYALPVFVCFISLHLHHRDWSFLPCFMRSDRNSSPLSEYVDIWPQLEPAQQKALLVFVLCSQSICHSRICQNVFQTFMDLRSREETEESYDQCIRVYHNKATTTISVEAESLITLRAQAALSKHHSHTIYCDLLCLGQKWGLSVRLPKTLETGAVFHSERWVRICYCFPSFSSSRGEDYRLQLRKGARQPSWRLLRVICFTVKIVLTSFGFNLPDLRNHHGLYGFCMVLSFAFKFTDRRFPAAFSWASSSLIGIIRLLVHMLEVHGPEVTFKSDSEVVLACLGSDRW